MKEEMRLSKIGNVIMNDLDIKIEIEKNQNWVNGPISFAFCIRDKNELNKQRKR